MRSLRRFLVGAGLLPRRSTLFWFLLTFVAMALVMSATMFCSIIVEKEPTHELTQEPAPEDVKEPAHSRSHDVRREAASTQKTRESLLLHAGHLLSILEQFSEESVTHPTAAGPGVEPGVRPVGKEDMTPEFLLSRYYETELVRLNNDYEKEIDSGYTENVVHSENYWSPFHATRRGYGLEGSIFVGITHSQEKVTSSEMETACAATVRNIYDAAHWPLGVFTGIVEITLSKTSPTTHDSTKSTETPMDSAVPPAEETPAWIPPPPSVCTPRAYLLPSCAERTAFCPTDNIRVRQVRVGPQSANGGDDAGISGRRKSHTLLSSAAAQRYATLALYRGETYVMFVRAGLQLVYKWDVLTRLLWLQLPSRSAVLSQPPVQINRQSVRSVWNRVVVKHVEGIVVASEKQFSTPANNGSLPLQPGEGQNGNGVEHWIDSIRWALDLGAVRLHSAAAAAAEEEGRSGGGRKTHENNEGDPGMMEEEIVQYVFHHDAEVFREAKKNLFRTDVNTPEGGKEEEKSSSGSRSRRDIQIYWLRQFYVSLREALLKDVVEQETTSCLSGVQMKRMQSGGHLDPIFRLHAASLKRISHAMQDPRYMRPSPFHGCGGSAKNACPKMSDYKEVCNDDAILPYLQQSWVTPDFLFTRAEAFFDFPRDGIDGYRDRLNADSVPLDPFLSFLGADEEAVLLSARLWTHGWDFFSSTEPIAFIVTKPPAEGDASGTDTSTLSPTLTRMRQRSVARLRHVLFGKNRTAGLAPDAKTEALRHVERYGLGRRRSREELFYFSGLREAMKDEGVIGYKVDAQHNVDPTCPASFCHS
ncbi:putative glycosyltransferase (GlcNAc) [Trypanosoma cruzi]|nr:putative glycosyltransferase (GlcNAc) [Trypanosoma cruzi]